MGQLALTNNDNASAGSWRGSASSTTLLVVLFVLAAVPGAAVARSPEAAWAADAVLRGQLVREVQREYRATKAPTRPQLESRSGGAAPKAVPSAAGGSDAVAESGAPLIEAPVDDRCVGRMLVRVGLLGLPPPGR